MFFENPTAGIKSFRILHEQRWIDGNLYYSSTGAPLIWDGYVFGDLAYHSLAEIHRARRFEHSGVVGDPQFVASGAFDFRLRSTSPAVDRGYRLGVVREDIFGVSRPRGVGHDLGAFESW